MCPGRDPRQLEGRAGRRAILRITKGHLREVGGRSRALAVLLTMLEAAYLPEVRPSIRGFGFDPAIWSEYRRTFRAEDAIEAAGYSLDALVPAAERLLAFARSFEPIGKWSDLVGLMHYSMWDEVEGLARLAID